MAQITLEIPDTHAPAILDAFAAVYGWTAGSGLTKIQFAKQQVGKYIKSVYQDYEAQQAAVTARQESVIETDQVIIT